MKKVEIQTIREFFTHDIWHVKLEKFPMWQRGAIKLARIVLLAVKDYTQKQLALRATALTLYTLLSIVPVIAMIFGIAQGFGLEKYLTEQLNTAFSTQPEILNNLLDYVHNLLGKSKGGVIAGVGFALLLWSVLQVLGNIEDAFNFIWYVQTPRTWTRKFTDYLSIILVAPLFIILSGVANIFISTQIKSFAIDISFLGSTVSNAIIISIKLLPYITTALLFFLLYLVMPNTRVKPSSALYAGIVGGFVFQIFQWAYIEFQVGVSNYNAIYGSFASIPLFITWLQFSWMIVLVGAEISYSVQNVVDYQSDIQTSNISHEMRMLYSLYILHYVSKRFKEGDKAPAVKEVAKKLDLPSSLCKVLLQQLMRAKLVAETTETKGRESTYLPAMDISRLNMAFVINKMESVGEMKTGGAGDHELHRIKELYNELEKAMFNSPANRNITEL